MTLNITELESVVPEIQHAIREGVFSGVECPNLYTCVLSFAPADGGAVRNLLFSRRPRMTRLNLEPLGAPTDRPRGRGSLEASRFEETLSHVLKGAVAGPMRPRFSDRVVSLDMLPGNQSEGFGSAKKMTLLFECTGMHPNLFLLDDRQMIVAMFGRSTSRKRALDVGCRYEQPGDADAVKSTGRRVDVMRFVESGVSLNEQISKMYNSLDDEDDKRRDLSGLGEQLTALVLNRRRVADSVRKDLELPVRPGRPDDLHDRLRERLERIQGEIDEAQDILASVRSGKIDQFDRARELVKAFEEKEAERERAHPQFERDDRGGRDLPRHAAGGGYQRRDDSAPRPPRPEGGYQRRDDSAPRPPRTEGGYQRRDDRDSRPPRTEGGYQRRDSSAPRPPRPEGGYPRRDDRDSRPPRTEGGYQRRDNSAPRPPRPEGGYPRRDDRDSRPPRTEGGYQRRDNSAPRPPRPEGGYPRRDDRDSRPPRTEGGYQRRDNSAPRPPRPEGGYPRRDDRDSRPPRTEGGYQRRDNSAPRPPRPEGGYPRRDDRDSRPPRTEGGYQRRDNSAPRPPRPEGGYPRRDDRDSRPPRTEGGYQRRDDSAPRPPRPEGGYPRRDDRDSRPPRTEGGYQRRDNSAPRPPRTEGGYQRRDNSAPRPPRTEGGYQRRDNSAPRPPRTEGGYPRRDDRAPRPPRRDGGATGRPRGGAPRQSPKRSTPRS